MSNTALFFVDFTNANLKGAYGIDNFDATTRGLFPLCPMEGSFVAYKKVDDKIMVLEIPSDAKRVSGTTLKCRCDKAKVLRIENLDGKVSDKISVKYDDLDYIVGKIVSSKNFNTDRWDNDGAGITFYISRELARVYATAKKIDFEELPPVDDDSLPF